MAAERVITAGLLAALFGCTAPTAPTVEAQPSAEDEALIAIATAFDGGDCEEVERLADGFQTTMLLRFEAVTVWYGRCRYRASDFEGAFALLDAVADGQSRYAADGLYFAARSAYRLGRFPDAAERFARYGARFAYRTRADDALYYKGRSLLRGGDAPGAFEAFGELLERADVSERRVAGALFYSAEALIEQATHAAADEWIDATELLQTVLSHYRESIYADNAAYELARIAYRRDDFAAAEAGLQAFLTEWDGSGLRHLAHYFLARAVEQQDDLPRALALFEEHESLFSDRAFADNARYRAGRILYEQEQYAPAEARFAGVLSDYPATTLVTAALYFQGRCRYEQAHYSQALAPLTTASDDTASSWADNAAYFAGRSHYRRVTSHGTQEYDAALVWFERVLATWPSSQYADDAAYFAGRSHFEQQRWSDAEAVLARIIDGYADSPYVDNALYYQTLSWVELGDCATASETYQALQAVDTADWSLKALLVLEATCGG